MPAADGNATKKPTKVKAQPKSYFKKTVQYNLGFVKPKPVGIAHDAPMTRRDKQVAAQRLDPSKAAPHLFHDVAPTQAERRSAAISAYKLLTPSQRLAFRIKYNPHPSVSKGTLENIVDPTHEVRAIGKGLQSLGATAVATYHDPIGVPKKTVEGGVKMLVAAPSGVVQAVTHPEKTLKAMVADEEHRHGQSFAAKVKRIRKEGAAPEVADALAVASIGGLTLGRGLTQVGRRLNWAHVVEPRPALRTATDLKPQELSHNYFKAVGQRAKDARRAKKGEHAATVAGAGGKPADAASVQAARANAAAGKVVEVAKQDSPRVLRRSVAKLRGQAIYGFKHDQGKRIKAAAKHINKLNSNERRAFYYATAFGIRDPAQALHVLPKLRDKIIDTRTRAGIQVTGSLKKSDMLPDLHAIIADPAAHFTPKLGDAVEALRADSMRAGREDPSLKLAAQRLRRRYAPLAEALDLHQGTHFGPVAPGQVPPLHYANETDAAYLRRLTEHVTKPVAEGGLGLAKPLYFKSERYVGPADYGTYALGGKRAMAADQRHKGVNLREGLQDTAPTQYLRGLGRNIKRKHNWTLVSDLIDKARVKELSPLGGSTVGALREKMAQRGIDMNGYALWNPGLYRTMARQSTEHVPDERFAAGEEFAQAPIAAAVNHATVRINQAGQIVDGIGKVIPPELIVKSHGWHVVPDPVLKELEAQMVPSGAPARSWDVAKGKASRLILLTGNLPWLGFQVASNAAVSTIATGGRILNPANWLHAHRWWHDLTPEEQRRVGSQLGLDASAGDTHQIKLGASTNKDFVNAYRALKSHPVFHNPILRRGGPSISDLNPLELMARADRSQNNVFRIATGYSLAKREALHRMGASMGHADRAQLAITHIFKKPPADMLHELANDPAVLEDHARAVNNWMGDYTTMTAAERKLINRAVMFYPYLRYSLRLVFWTMPVHHPLVTALLAELGKLKSDELNKLFGNSWSREAGKLFLNNGTRSIDFARANPALNAVVSAVNNRSLGQLLGVAPPMVAAAVDQITQESTYTGKDWAIHGHAAQYGGPHLSALDPDRLRILASDIAGLTFPYRTAVKLTQPGPKGDDSLLGWPRPTVYTGTTTVSKLQRKFGAQREAFQAAHDDLLHELIPLLPQADRSAKDAQQAAIVTRASAAPAKHHHAGSKPKYNFSSGGGSSKPHYDFAGSG